MKHSESVTKIAAALLEAQSAIEGVTKTSRNPHFGNTYADLNAFLHAVRQPLADNGITLIQSPGMRDGWVTVETLLLHESGEWIRGQAGSPLSKADPQGAGSAITYLRRYSLAALLAIPQEDDDGNAASTRESVGQGSKPASSSQDAHAPECPNCSSEVWDNREKKRTGQFNARSPDYACKDKDGCGWVLWVDTARSELKKDLERLRLAEVIGGDAVENCLSGTESGDLDALRIAQDYVANKEKEAQESGKVPQGAAV